MASVADIEKHILDTALATLEQIFGGYGVVLTIVTNGDAQMVANIAQDEVIKVFAGMVAVNCSQQIPPAYKH